MHCGVKLTSLSRRHEIRICPAPHSKFTVFMFHLHQDAFRRFFKGQRYRDKRATMSARIAQRGIARSLSAFRACHWRERRSQKSLSRSGRSRRRCAARGEAGSVALVCAESARTRQLRNNTFKRTRVSTRSSLLMPIGRSSFFNKTPRRRRRRRRLRRRAVSSRRLFAHRIFRKSGRYERRHAHDVVPRIPPIYLLIQCNSMRLFCAHTVRSFVPSSFLVYPFIRLLVCTVNT